MQTIVEKYCEFPALLRRPMWRIWHRLLIRFDRDSGVNFMNYGYANLNGDKAIELRKEDERNRYCIQLYDHLAGSVEIENRNVVEIGSGRGGGAYYISRYYKPASYTGIDISSGVIEFCNRNYYAPGLGFREGRAEKIPSEPESCDVVVNVESARCYSNIELFFREVHRILRPSGKFLFADMIEKNKVNELKEKLGKNGFKFISANDITQNVSRGLELDNERREQLIDRKIPRFLKSSFSQFAGTKGTERFDSFRNGKFEYWSFVLEKNGLDKH